MLNIEKIVGEGLVTVNLTGRLDTNTSAELKAELEPIWTAGEMDIVMDLSNLAYVSSAGLRVFLTSEKRCKASGKTMKLTGVSQSIREIFDIVGFSGILTIE